MPALDGRVALVTGGSRGIGRAIALHLAQQGAAVVVNYNTNADAANAVVEHVTTAGGRAAAFQADVSQEDAANALVAFAADTFGALDVLVNNAGTTRDTLIMRMKAEDFDTVLSTNLRSAWLCSKAAVRPMMRRRYGRIINITSVSGLAGQAGQTNYSASKAGLVGLTKALAREVADRGITVNAVAPGFIETDLTANLPQDIVAQLHTQIPMKRWGTPDDVAHAVGFLAGEGAGYITGAVLSVDGGLVMS